MKVLSLHAITTLGVGAFFSTIPYDDDDDDIYFK
jgi:hypothetical protein